jgi:hypothetical protein
VAGAVVDSAAAVDSRAATVQLPTGVAAVTGVGGGPAGTSAGAGAEAGPEVGGRQAKERGRWWRGFTGSVAAGLAVLAVGVLGAAVVCSLTSAPGPGLFLLVGHPVAAVVAFVAQRVADRRNGAVAGVAGAGVLVIAFVALTLFWWA